MTKTLKKVIVGAFSAVAILLAGLFFASCTYDISNVNVTASVSSLTLELGGMNESQDVTFTINNAPDSFTKTLRFNVDNEGVVDISSPTYNGNEVTITITAVAGGSTNIMAITEEGYRYTSIRVNVIQHSNTMTFNNSSLYLSNSTPFVANNGYYYFDSNTTDKEMTFYYIDTDLSNYTFLNITDNEIVFTNNSNSTNIRLQIGTDAFAFDTAYIDEDASNVVFTLNDEVVVRTESVMTRFNFLAFYDYSINYTTQLAYVNTVDILPDLEVNFEGGYLISNAVEGEEGVYENEVVFSEIDDEILIVPNYTNYDSYILKINVLNNSDLIDFNFSLSQNEYVQINTFDYEEDGIVGQVYYLRISHLIFDNLSENLRINVKYNMIDDDVQDESVNLTRIFNVNIVVAPKEILINGISASEYSNEDNPITLYNRYEWEYPEFGWNELLVSASASVDASPVYSYAYIEFDNQELEFEQGNVSISSGRPVTNLSTAFQFRGVEDAARTDVIKNFTIYVVCEDILDENGDEYVLAIDVYYEIVEGATNISRNANIGDGTTLYLDYEDTSNETEVLSNYLYADAYFQSLTFEFLSGEDVVSFVGMEETCLPNGDNTEFYLNFGVRARRTGTGVYNILLDNGTSTTVTFTVINTMKEESTYIDISDIGNIAYYERTQSSDDLEYYDVLNLEILNPTTSTDAGYVVQYGISSSITFSGYIQNVTAIENANNGWVEGVVNYSKLSNTYQIQTESNGQTSIMFTVSGYVVDPITYTRQTEELSFRINIISYSLLSEFAFLNNGRYAVDNVVYYGDSSYIPENDRQITFSIRAETSDSYNFYQYSFTDTFISDFLDNVTTYWDPTEGVDDGGEIITTIDSTNLQEYLVANLVTENYDNKFVYYYVETNPSNTNETARPIATSTTVTISMGGQPRKATIVFENGFMFYVENPISTVYTFNGRQYDVVISFTNEFAIGQGRYFNLDTLTYVHKDIAPSTFTIHSYVSQRDYTQMRYDINITATNYTPVTDVSTASVIDELVFTNSNLVESFVVYVTPQNATNTTLRAEYIPDNTYSSNLVEVTITAQVTGTYLVEVSAESFYESTSNIDDIDDVTLAGQIYIYPIEWGESASVITDYNPIEIDVSYRNGSEKNRYILETPADVFAIGTNEKTLSSHYEIRNLIDLSNFTGTTIGMVGTSVNGENILVGFSGSIVGTTSQAGISGINLTSNSSQLGISPFTLNTENYYGLFAQIEEGAYIKNVSLSGSFNLTASLISYIGILSGKNYGKISNVSVNVAGSNSSVIATGNELYIGAVVGYNYGEIIQYYPAYNTQDYADLMNSDEDFYYTISDVAGEFGFNNQTVKNMAYFDSKLTVSAPSGTINVGGVAGATSGNITRIDDESLNIYGYSTYSAYVNIEISNYSANQGSSTATIYAGGIVGYAESTPTEDNISNPLTLSNLIVGGEVDSQYVDTGDIIYQTAVGGIVGFATIGVPPDNSTNAQNINIFDNTSRVFLRGQNYVGGIIGVDNYGYTEDTGYDGYGGNDTIISGIGINYNERDDQNDIISYNKVEAVDDGRAAYDASMFIVRSGEKRFDTENEEVIYDDATIISIGNVRVSNRGEMSNFQFDVITYVSRGVIENTNYSQSEISRNDYYGDYIILDTSNTIVERLTFEYSPVNIGLTKDDFKLNGTTADATDYVYLAYYFSAESLVSSQNDSIVPQDIVDELNTFSTNSNLYPFAIDTRDAEIISTSSGYINVDTSGNITTLGEGLATVRLQSILNVQTSINIYLQIVNFFNKDVQNSVFYTSNTSNGQNIINNTSIYVYGSRQTSIYAVATYDYEHKTGVIVNDREEVDWSVSRDGILRYQDMSFQLSENTSISVSATSQNGTNVGNYTRSIVNGQQILFIRNSSNNGYTEGYDVYTLDSYIEAEINGEIYRMSIGSSRNAETIDLNVYYQETATNIQTASNMISMETNETFEDKVSITSQNTEYVYYEIYMLDENGGNLSLVQSRMGDSSIFNASEEEKLNIWKSYMNTFTDSELFFVVFDKSENNVYDFSLSVNRESVAYENKDITNIYGTYKIVFYANELYDGVSCEYIFNLSEAKISNVVVDNYSNINNISIADQVIVPSQYGILEISVDPVDAEFETFTISNNQINSNEGAGIATFNFVYQTSENGFISFVPDIEFGNYSNGTFTFTYREMIDYFTELNANLDEEEQVGYSGRIYIRYMLSSSGVEDSIPIRFDISISYYDDGLVAYETSIDLTTKLANYANLSFDDREESDVYYVARGLSYGMTLDYYGFGLSDIQITVSNPNIATMQGENRNYSLNITSNEIPYTGDVGYKLVINVYASRIVDNVTVEYSQEIVVYVMEYVFNYQYVEGVSEDLVSGMNDGVISTAVGNAYSLTFDIWDFMEYDSSNAQVVASVETFINRLTSTVAFEVVNNVNSTREVLQEGKELRTDYYIINGLTFTAIRLYEPEMDIYYFTVEGQYAMNNGVYICDMSSGYEQHKLYTTFTFSIHQQSTDESPLPIESYEDFLNMEDGEYYILLTDIVLPNSESLEYDQFMPIEAQVAGFDGNGYTIMIGGDYRFDSTVSNVGVFANIGTTSASSDAVFKNVTIEIYANTNFIMESDSFSIGLLAANNNAIVTNCQTISSNGAALSVTYTNTVSGSYVAGLIGMNNGVITNSMSSLDIMTNVNLSGFVASNTGTISSSAFRGGSLLNETNTSTEYTSGFVLQNTGEIYTSYVSGIEEDTVNPNNVYYAGSDDFIQSDNTIAGFVYQNSGFVKDCYTNINMEHAGSISAGFVYENAEEGEIQSSFSTSVLSSYNTQSFGFARANSGYIWDCYYLSQASTIDEDTGIDNPIVLYNINGVINNNSEVTIEEDVNISISTLDANPNRHNVRALSFREFTISEDENGNSSNFEENFKNFTHTTSRNYNSVWFYNSQNSSSTFNGKVFNLNRLELVAPNITAFSQRYLYSTEEVVDEETGITTVQYNYANTAAAGETGSVYNPILLDNAEHFENYILNENDRNNYNYAYYRIINNIDYSEFSGNSSLYTTHFMGYIEGNFLSVSNIHMVSSESLQLAGLFAEVGSSSRVNAVGTLLNFDLEPNEMVFTNAQVAGAVAGRLDSGTIANVNVISDDNIMITGRNIVGGLVGLAVGNYTISNAESSLSARATYIATDSNEFDSNSTVYRYYSFAGSIVGVASGTGVINQVEVNSDVSVVGAKAGGLIGFIDENVVARELTLTVSDGLIINAFNYGGLVVGETAGDVSEVEVTGSGNFMQIFSLLPYTPSAVGGFAGIISGGTIDSISISQSLDLSDTTSSSGVSYMGGLAGIVNSNTEISNIDIDASLTGFMAVGGLVGIAQGDISVLMNNINYSGNLSILGTSQSEVYMGGVIALADGQAVINIDSSISDAANSEIGNYYSEYIDETSDNKIVIPDESSTDGFTTISTDFAIDENGVLIESYRNSANNININGEITIYVYNTNSIIFFGEIIGYLDSGTINVANTISNADLVSGVYDMVATSITEETSTLISQASETGYDYYISSPTEDEPEYLTGTGYINGLTGSSSGSNINVYSIGNRMYNKGSYFATLEDDVWSATPIYSQNISFSYYTSANSSDASYILNVYNIGTCVDDAFLGV